MWRQPYRLLVEQPCVPNYARWKLHYFFFFEQILLESTNTHMIPKCYHAENVKATQTFK